MYAPICQSNTPCQGPGTLLGQLGSLVWFRCRNCGYEFSIPASEVEYDSMEQE